MTVTINKLSEKLSKHLGINKREAKQIILHFFDIIGEALEKGEKVKLPTFGNFDVKHKSPRPGRNPKTGEPAIISERNVISFKASQKLKDKVQQYDASEG